MWDLPRTGLEPMSPAFAGRLSTTVPPGKPQLPIFNRAATSQILLDRHNFKYSAHKQTAQGQTTCPNFSVGPSWSAWAKASAPSRELRRDRWVAVKVLREEVLLLAPPELWAGAQLLDSTSGGSSLPEPWGQSSAGLQVAGLPLLIRPNCRPGTH